MSTNKKSALDELVEGHFTELSVTKKANWHIYQQLLDETAELLQEKPEVVQDVLLQLSIQHGDKLGNMLSSVHGFLRLYRQYQREKEQA